MKFFRLTTAFAAIFISGSILLAEEPGDTNLPDEDTHQLILIGVDGLEAARVDHLLAAHQLPNFSRLIQNGGSDSIATITGHNIPITAPGNAELLTGLGSSDTEIADNTCGRSIPAGDTIFERLNDFDSSIHLGSIYGKGTCYIPEALLKNAKPAIEWWQTRTTYPQRTYIAKQCADARDVASKALEFIASHQAQSFFLLVYFGNPDCAGHRFGEPSVGYDQALENVDAGLGLLMDGFAKNNVAPKIILTADHGWNEGTRSHNKPDSNTMIIPLLTNDAALLGTIFPPERKQQCDIAPTILDYFGMDPTEYFDISDGECSSFLSPE